MSDIVANIIVKVHLSSGKEISHIYDVPKSEEELNKLIRELVEIEKALVRGRIGFLNFQNPSITYNPDNIEGIEITSMNVEQLESLLRRTREKTGFIKK